MSKVQRQHTIRHGFEAQIQFKDIEYILNWIDAYCIIYTEPNQEKYDAK